MKINLLKSNLKHLRIRVLCSIILVALLGSIALHSKTNFEFVNLRPLDTTAILFSKVWFLNNDGYAFYDGSKIFFKKGINSVMNEVKIDTSNTQLTVSSVQMNDFDEFLVQLSNNDIYLLENEFKDIKKITQLFTSDFKFSRIVCDHANNFYAFNDSLIYSYNSKTAATKLINVPGNITLKDIFVEKSGKKWILTSAKLYWTDDFVKWNEAKINGIELYNPVAITESDEGYIYVALINAGIVSNSKTKEEFNFESYNIKVTENSIFNNIYNGLKQLSSPQCSYLYIEKENKWEFIDRQFQDSRNILNHLNKRYEFNTKISNFWIFDDFKLTTDSSENWQKSTYYDVLNYKSFDIIKIKEDIGNNRFYTFYSNNYYCEWDYEKGIPIKYKHIPIKNNNTENDLIHRKVYFTKDWKYYFYLTIMKSASGYNIELYDIKNDSLIREFYIDNSDNLLVLNDPISSAKPDPLSIYFPESGDFFISIKNSIGYTYDPTTVLYNIGFLSHGGFYRINLKNKDIVINQICQAYTPDFKVNLNKGKLFYSNQSYNFGLEITYKGVFVRSWDNRSSSINYYDLNTNVNYILADTDAIAGSFLEVDNSFTSLITNFGSNLIKYDISGKFELISKIGNYSYENGKTFDNNKFLFFEDRHFEFGIAGRCTGNYYFYNIENDYKFKNLLVDDYRNYDADFNKESKTLLAANNSGDILRYICTDNFKVKSDFNCLNYCWVNQNISFSADSNMFIRNFLGILEMEKLRI